MELVIGTAPPATGQVGERQAALPDAARLGRAVLGFAALGGCAALGAEPGAAGALAPSAVVMDLGALVLTAPTLLVGHQALGLQATAADLAGAITRAACRTGEIALALCPALLWFSATSGLAPVVLGLFLAGLATVGLASAWTGLLDAERAGGALPVVDELKMRSLTAAWMGLTALVGLRLGAHLIGL